MSELDGLVKFTVPAIPIAQPRPRAVAVNGRARVFGAPKSHAVHAFKATCRMAAQQAYRGPPIDRRTGVSIEMLFILPRPSGLPKRFGMDRFPHVKKPDFDNLEKAVVDSLTGICWVDDSQLCSIRTKKFVAAEDEAPHVEIYFRPM